MRVVTAGHVNWDVTLRVDRLPRPDGESRIRSQRRSGGGSAANVAVALSGLEIEAGIVGSVGDDENGLLAKRGLRQAGVDLGGLIEVEGVETAVKYLLVDDDGEVSILGNDGGNEAVGPDDVDPGYVGRAEHVHLTSQRPETAARVAEIASQRDIPVSFDPGRRLPDRDFSATFESADYLFLNELEADAFEAPYDRTLVVTRGDGGAVVHTPDATYEHPGFGIDPVDTAGAGDAFAAGFIAARLEGRDHERALAFANACGALAASREGARTAPMRETVESLLN